MALILLASGCLDSKGNSICSIEEMQGIFVPQPSPEKSVRLELDLMKQGLYCYDLPIFDKRWRERGSEIKRSERYKDTADKFDTKTRTFIVSDLAIVYFPEDSSLGPVFLFRIPEGWVIDRTAVWEYIHYNYTNDGWYAYDGKYPYLEMLRQVYDMKPVRLKGGIRAWETVK